MEYLSGSKQNKGFYKCKNCGTFVELKEYNTLPPCPTCGFNKFDNK